MDFRNPRIGFAGGANSRLPRPSGREKLVGEAPFLILTLIGTRRPPSGLSIVFNPEHCIQCVVPSYFALHSLKAIFPRTFPLLCYKYSMTDNENWESFDKLSTGGRSNHQHWSVCTVCRGGGKRTRKPSPRVRRRYKRALRDASPSDEPPKPPVDHIEDCAGCRGSGLVEAVTTIAPNTKIPRVAIVGGGIGGLALAVACRHRGIPCAIYERDENFDQRAQGYGLTMQQASKALECLGIYELAGGLTSTKHVVHNAEGKVIGSWGLRKWGRSAAKSAPRRRNIHIPRQALRLALLEALGGPDQLHWNHRLLEYHESSGQVNLSFQEGADTKQVQADVLVGADGIRSAVRQQCIGDELSPLRYLGCMVILGICSLENIEASELLDRKTVFQTANGNERMYMMPYSPTSIMWQLSFPIPEDEAKALNRLGGSALKEEALRRCPAWHAPIPQVLVETSMSEITGYPAYDRELLRTDMLPETSRVTLVGDAAHPMSPFKGQGANQALLDALSLARNLYANDEPQKVAQPLRAFEAEMLARTAPKVIASAEAAQFLHSDVAIYEGNMSRGDAARIVKGEED